jgi:hypothetical protein
MVTTRGEARNQLLNLAQIIKNPLGRRHKNVGGFKDGLFVAAFAGKK